MNKIIKAELISIGNELLSGITVNTNASWLGRKLVDSGIEVNWITTVRDTPSEIESALQISLGRADIIISTGGLGPTPDDLTRQAICRFFNTTLILHQATLDKIKMIFEGRNLTMPEINQVQAMVPESANLIPNPTGTAPGLEMEKDGKIFYFVPGVPLEMKMMVEQAILEKLKSRFELQTIPGHLFRTTGLPESRVYEKIAVILDRFPEFQVAFLPKSSGIDIRLKNLNFTSEAEQRFTDCLQEIKHGLNKYIYTETEATLPQVIGKILIEKKMTLSIGFRLDNQRSGQFLLFLRFRDNLLQYQ
jgi:nicotinamide-nucleotide amidase